jgi:hypothetical protein
MRRLIVLSLSILTATVVTASAEITVFSNLGPGGTFDNSGTWLGADVNFDSANFVAQSFVPSTSGKLARIEAALRMITSTPASNQVTLSLLPSASYELPILEPIWTQTFTGQVVQGAFHTTLSSFSVANGPVLTAGVQYWLYVETPLLEVRPMIWSSGFEGVNPIRDRYIAPIGSSGNWQPVTLDQPGRALQISIVPEPVSAMPILLAGTGLRRRRRV